MNNTVKYATFWERFGAYILDSIIIGIPSYTLNYLNYNTARSFYIVLPIVLLGMLYKPYMESKYQATLGKMILQIKVTDVDFQKINFEKSLVRSLIFMVPVLLSSIPLQYLGFNNPNLVEIENYWDFSTQLGITYPTAGIINLVFSMIFLIDLIMLLADDEKKGRSLKDRMAKTYVIKK
ncbi:RDD family protein [Joostella sp. CR20]|uniref:RDD family protein n=1 Tax=Joostella sp. CR20 TaxID=2804312 RepID=UPI00313CE6E1